MCNCYSDSEQRLRQKIQAQLPEGAVGLEVELQGYVFGLGDPEGITHRAACPVAIEYQAPKKAGGLKMVKQKTFLRARFCPFCGEAYDKAEPYADPRSGADTWSANGEDWHDIGSVEELIRETANDLAPLEVGSIVYVGTIRYQDPAEFVDRDMVLAGISENADSSDAGEWTDGYPSSSEAANQELTDLLEAWARKHCRPDFYLVDDSREYVITADDIARAGQDEVSING